MRSIPPVARRLLTARTRVLGTWYPGHFIKLGLILLLPIGLIGCGSETDTATTDTAETDTTATDTADKESTATSGSKDTNVKVVKIGESGFQISVPSEWTVKTGAGNTLIKHPDANVSVAFIPTSDPKAVIQTLKKNHQGPGRRNYKEEGPAEATQVGELEASEQSGTVEMQEKDQSWSKAQWAITTVKSETPIVISIVGPEEVDQKHADELDAMADSIEPTS